MAKKTLYIIAGCNGAGKTTASYTILPEIIQCKEFVNADEIAKGLSPFQPEKVAFEAGRIMLERIDLLLEKGESFAFETTLSTRSHRGKLLRAKRNGYKLVLIFFWLNDMGLAIERVKNRVKEGGHNIPERIIRRRYKRGIKNLFEIYWEIVNEALLLDNSGNEAKLIVTKGKNKTEIYDNIIFSQIKNFYEKFK